MNWVYLYVAIGFEVFGTTALKLSGGLQKPWFFAASLGLYGVSFSLLAVAIKTTPIGVAYAVWSGVGTFLIVLVGLIWFNEALTPMRVLFMTMILIGAIGLNLSTKS